MLARILSFVLRGIDGVPCEIEVDLGPPADRDRVVVVGLPDAAVRESAERVRSAIENCELRFPLFRRVIINLAPADLRKEGPVYDLPIALAMLLANGGITPVDPEAPDPDHAIFAGELALDGRLRPVRGAISLALLARALGRRYVVVPAENASEASVVKGVTVLSASTLQEVVDWLNGAGSLPVRAPVEVDALVAAQEPEIDFALVRGQEPAKRALTVAAAGGHNLLMIGPAGTGKTMMARALPGILPPLLPDEAIEVTRIHSAAGALPPGTPVLVHRPVRTPHHTASAPALVGGGSVPRPGDVSLAHRGVLFLDELAEFSRDALETLRQPLEDGFVTIARAQGSVRFPARFMLVGAVNPTHRGGFGRGSEGARDMSKYLSKLSGPLIDRIDLHVEVPAVPFSELGGPPKGTGSATMRERVAAARARQRERQGAVLNTDLRGRALDRHARIERSGVRLLERAMEELGLSARAYDRIRRMARTVADLEGEADIAAHHVAEGIAYRLLDRPEMALR